ncbi:dihydrolipoamide dehydrogenase [Nocardioides ginsengisegetis]|uniref:Dihydrolipoyl dehydrogenase n=1 Tax=Nocardioides ginsengisegetis TaxID=661491 RepID=A0A7W3P972_9ACTN|nr:dihydrolipoyl dehydrogenase [Nocardioides ginsengisegetis]MBA8803248.1 dihydrolipoamide dehydrogenase [Nocardioides ginsengisegetis]
MTVRTFDVVVLGGGSGGYACALRAAQLGLSVALVEQDKVGGTCLHSGCIPTKALLHAAEIADSARDAIQFGVHATFDHVEMGAVHRYKDAVVSRLFKGLTGLISGRGIEIIAGAGRVVGPRSVAVGGETVTGRNLVIATGSTTRTLPGLELDGVRTLSSEHALKLDRVPEAVVILGGGVIGCEFASAWRSFGAAVTVIEALPRLVPGEEESSSLVLERAFRRRGINVRTDTAYAKHEDTEAGVLVHVSRGDSVEADLMLVAVGRTPTTADIGLEQHGVRLNRDFVVTDERLSTDVDGVYAVGDVVAGLQLAHRGFAHGVFVAEEIAGLDPVPVQDELVPRVTYSNPEVASVGLTEVAARARYGDDVETQTYDLGGNGKSQIMRAQGQIKLVRKTGGPVVGVHMVGEGVGELISEAQMICGWEAFPSDVARLIHAHPTQGEALGEAHLALAGKPLHAHN